MKQEKKINSLDIMSDVVVYGKYARYLEGKKRREDWNEIVTRNAVMHIEKYPELTEEISQNYQEVYGKRVVPSMRSMQFAGKTIELMPNRMYNCAFVNMDDYRAFREIMFLLLGGSGVGFSVQSKHTANLPEVRKPAGEVRYVVQDSIVGWADAIDYLVKAYLFGTPRPRFDFSDIRAKGSRLVTSGGKAPGSEPLEKALFEIELILRRSLRGYKLRPIDVFDINCHIANAVLAGGIRRSATIALFDHYDEDMLTSKSTWNLAGNEQRYRANISAVLHREKDGEDAFQKVFQRLVAGNTGEPGFFWTNDYDMGTNPCAEISIPNMGFCNLTEVNLGAITNQTELNQAVKSAAFIGTLQAGYTDFFFLRDGWRKNAERDALLGVSLTGIASCAVVDELDFKEAAEVAVKENQRVSKIIGINEAKRVTTVKPSGTTSLALRTSSGIHGWHSPYYIRRQKFSRSEPIYSYLARTLPTLTVDDIENPAASGVLEIPVKAPDGATFRDEGAIELLERVGKFNREWIGSGHKEGVNKHNVSCTISVKSDEWDVVREWMWNNRNDYGGIALFPYWDADHPQLPFEEITREVYEKMVEGLHHIDLTEIIENEDETDLKGEIACGGGGCEVV